MTVYKAVSDVIKNISMAENRGTGPPKTIKTECIRPLKIVFNRFSKYESPVRMKPLLELEFSEWLCIKGKV